MIETFSQNQKDRDLYVIYTRGFCRRQLDGTLPDIY